MRWWTLAGSGALFGSCLVLTSIAPFAPVTLALADGAADASLMTLIPAQRKARAEIGIRVRTIQASELLEGVEFSSSRNVDPRIQELLPKLRRLPFRTFRLMHSINERLSMRQRDTLLLANGHSLTVRPMYHEDERLGVWLKWTDGDGETLLDTRMHFGVGDTMLAGTERSNDSGVILAIDLEPEASRGE